MEFVQRAVHALAGGFLAAAQRLTDAAEVLPLVVNVTADKFPEGGFGAGPRVLCKQCLAIRHLLFTTIKPQEAKTGQEIWRGGRRRQLIVGELKVDSREEAAERGQLEQRRTRTTEHGPPEAGRLSSSDDA